MPHTPLGWALSATAYVDYLERLVLLMLDERQDADVTDPKDGTTFAAYNIRQQITINRTLRDSPQDPDGR